MKRITALLLALLISISVCMPLISYASDSGGSWSTTSNKEFVAGMKAYSKAFYNISTEFADVGYGDPITSSIINWSYGQWLRAANKLGISMSDFQDHMRYRVSNDESLQFWYDGSYIQYFNALVQKYCEEHGLNINADFNTELYRGEIYTDPEGNNCYITYINSNISGNVTGASIPNGSYLGSAYKYENPLTAQLPLTFTPITGTTFTLDRNSVYQNNQKFVNIYLGTNQLNSIWQNGEQVSFYYQTNLSNVSIIKSKDNKYYLGSYIQYQRTSKSEPTSITTYEQYSTYGQIIDGQNNALNAIISAAKDGMPAYTPTPDNNAIVQAGKYGADVAKAILDYIDDQDPEEPTADPNVPDGGEPDLPSPPSGDDLLPGLSFDGKPFHFTMPDFSNFNWSISGLQEKFPFSIPFDMINFFQVLDANPETPEFRINVNIANVHFDETISLEPFDNIMSIFRNVILAGWCIFLIVATRSVFKVY